MSNIITFYSYKGGVGRTMALANVSIQLARWGHKVLVVDWDIEAPGLEHFYSDFVDIEGVKKQIGIVDLLQIDNHLNWQDSLNLIEIDGSESPIHLIGSGKRDEDYFRKVRSFDIEQFYLSGGGDNIENLSKEWLENYDFVLVDSRTGITEIGGICTIQLPNIVVMLFTSTEQGFQGTIDIIKRANSAHQQLSYDRQKLIYLPVPSKFETTTEYILSQEWIERFANELDFAFSDWLPSSVNKKEFLELVKIPYIPYFSFGEKLPIVEQGTRDPSGLGYAYQTLAGLIGNNLDFVGDLFVNRALFLSRISQSRIIEYDNGSFGLNISALSTLKNKLKINTQKPPIEKNKLVFMACLNDNIFPLINTISQRVGEIGVLFKNKEEFVEIQGTYNDIFGVKKIHKISAINLFKEYIINLSSNPAISEMDIQFISYNIAFSSLRKTNELEKSFAINFVIVFHKLVYEVLSENGDVYFDRSYNDPLAEFEIEKFVDRITNELISQIQSILN